MRRRRAVRRAIIGLRMPMIDHITRLHQTIEILADDVASAHELLVSAGDADLGTLERLRVWKTSPAEAGRRHCGASSSRHAAASAELDRLALRARLMGRGMAK
jgi:hypothetical protein